MATPKTVISSEEGYGIMVDLADPSWCWRDIEGLIYPEAGASTSPVLRQFLSGISAYSYGSGDANSFSFHIPHDYAKGTDLFIHVHWAHNGTAVGANTITFSHNVSYAKGYQQEIFPATKTIVSNYDVVDLATTPRYQHNITEVQLSQSGGGGLLDTDGIEVDGVILGTTLVTIPANTITGSTFNNEIFIFTMDLHYQSTNIGTKNKSPNFYGT